MIYRDRTVIVLIAALIAVFSLIVLRLIIE